MKEVREMKTTKKKVNMNQWKLVARIKTKTDLKRTSLLIFILNIILCILFLLSQTESFFFLSLSFIKSLENSNI